MTETSKERRAHPRFAIQGATVRYLIHGPDVRESDYPISYPLMELSRGGMSFITESALKPESALSISLSGLRMEETLRMTGRVVYCRASEVKPSHYYKDATFKWLEDRYWSAFRRSPQSSRDRGTCPVPIRSGNM
jgi:hypothetical protein